MIDNVRRPRLRIIQIFQIANFGIVKNIFVAFGNFGGLRVFVHRRVQLDGNGTDLVLVQIFPIAIFVVDPIQALHEINSRNVAKVPFGIEGLECLFVGVCVCVCEMMN